ncbi:MAG TPA: hypothetical protein VE403_08685 [Sphingomicrobium sp.]|nr:hypothetical protein [Sphingomicrobium sp.]
MLIIAVAIPFVLVTFLGMLEHWESVPPSAFNVLPWQFNMALVILPGLIPISYLRWELEWRIVAGLIYFLTAFLILPLYALVFHCMFTGDCI